LDRGGNSSPLDVRGDAATVPYLIVYSPETERHFRPLTARQRAVVFGAVDEQLAHQPTVATRNRKAMRPNRVAPWELRIGELRVYYEVMEEPERRVLVLAVGIKDRNRVIIGGEEVTL
jgi:mRNA-degrading endonuclease RelE of RelBE toxin-antitoxin system